MLGIDIVDLNDPKLKERNERSLDLIKNPKDQMILHPQVYWLLWSAKEAVFKCLRETINFSPTSIPIQLEVENGEITFKSNTIEGEIRVTKDYILALCSDDLSQTQHKIIKKTTIIDGDMLRDEIKNHLANEQVEIGSDDLNLPILLPSKEAISISHHGNYGAFIYPTSITQ